MLPDIGEQIRGSVLASVLVCNKEPTSQDSAESRRRRSHGEKIPKKVYKTQDSILTEVFSSPSGRSIYNMIIIAIAFLYAHLIATDLIQGNRINLGFELLLWALEDVATIVAIWIGMQCAATVAYFGYSFWATVRLHHISHKWEIVLWNFCFLCVFLAYHSAMTLVPAYFIITQGVKTIGAAGLLIEQLRFLVKVYSFVRSMVPKVNRCRSHQQNCGCRSSFKQYSYFLFAPTLVYMDEYPRSPKFRLTFFLKSLLETTVIILMMSLFVTRWILPRLQDFTAVSSRPWQLVAATIQNAPYCLVLYFISFYAFSHSGFNTLSELSFFGDRLSYKDWWNASSFAYYYRTWNLSVQDWLFMQVYREAYNHLLPSKYLSSSLVFIVSGLMHEYVASITLGFFYPAMFFMLAAMGPVMLLFNNIIGRSRVLGNLFFWFGLTFGTSFLASCYISEYYSRVNCPRTMESDILNFLVPRSWTCSLP